MNIYLPVWLYRVRYELAWGRPHSDIDRLVLKALAQQPTTLNDLCVMFGLHNSLAVEVLVTLARAGWVALEGKSSAFYTTAGGKRAIEENELPPFINIEPRTDTIVVERLLGGISSRNEVSFHPSHKLEEHDAQFTVDRQIKGEFAARRLDGGQAEGLLPCEPPRWLRWIDMPVCVSETHWVCANVDLERGEIGGLPERWRRTLGSKLLDFAAKCDGRAIPVARLVERDGPVPEQTRYHSVDIQRADLLATPEAHAALLIKALGEAATFIYVASAFFNPSVLGDATRAAIICALKRGVRVGFLWGYEEGTAARQAVQWMDGIRREASAVGRNLHFNEIASGSHAKFLFHDPDGQPTFYIGSCNFLSCAPIANPSSPLNLTLRVRDKALLAELLRTFASLWLNVPQQPWSPAAAHLQQIASELARLSTDPSVLKDALPACKVRLVRDQEHEAIMLDMLGTARDRLWIASHKIGPKARIRLTGLLKSQLSAPAQALVNFELSSVEEAHIAALKSELEARGIRFERRPQMHCKCVVADQRALVSSFNFMSADPFNNSSNAREVGLLIEGGTLPTELWNRFAEVRQS